MLLLVPSSGPTHAAAKERLDGVLTEQVTETRKLTAEFQRAQSLLQEQVSALPEE